MNTRTFLTTPFLMVVPDVASPWSGFTSVARAFLAFLVLSLFATPDARADYITLDRAQPFQVEVTTQTRAALTVLTINQRGSLVVEDVMVFDTTTGVVEMPVPSKARRMIFFADTNRNAPGTLRISQGINRWEIPLDPRASVQADVQ